MADYITKKGESLINLKVGLTARTEAPDYKEIPVDLTSATVTVNIRHYDATTNVINNVACSIVSPATGGVVRGPPQALDTTGGYIAVFKVTGLTNGPHEFPSDGIFRIQVQDDLS